MSSSHEPEELIDIVDEQGVATGEVVPYGKVHTEGLLHRSAHVWIRNSKGEILLQKRSSNKVMYPDHWDASAAGHVSSGETSVHAAQKETREELGIELPETAFTLLATVRSLVQAKQIENELYDVYVVEQDLLLEELTLDPNEVSDVRWLPLADFRSWIAGKGELLVAHPEEYVLLLAYLEGQEKL